MTLADDGFPLVDQAVGILAGSPLHELVQIEYRSDTAAMNGIAVVSV